MKHIVLAALAGAALMTQMAQADAACQTQPVVMWVSPGCVWCVVARRTFARFSVSWVERDSRRAGISYTPTFWIDGVTITGYNKVELARNLCLDRDLL